MLMTVTGIERGASRRWRTTTPVTWHIGRKQSGRIITIPAGREFETSVPWWGRWFIARDDPRYLLGSLVHDVMLEDGIFGPLQAAAEWYDGAIAGGAPAWRAKIAVVLITAHAARKLV